MTGNNTSSLQAAMDEMVVVGSPEEETKTTDEEAKQEETTPGSTGKADPEKDSSTPEDPEAAAAKEEKKSDVDSDKSDADSDGTPADADSDGKVDADSDGTPDANSDADSEGTTDEDDVPTRNRMSSRIKRLTDKAKESDDRQSAAEQRAITAEREAAQAKAELKISRLDELDFDNDEAFEAAKQAIIDEVPKEQIDPMREYQLIEASNTIIDAGADWENKPKSFFEDLQKAPFGDDTLLDIAEMDQAAQVAHTFARRPHQLALINRMTPEQRKPILEAVQEELTAKAAKKAPTKQEEKKPDPEKNTDADSDGTQDDEGLTPTGAIPAGESGDFSTDSIDAYESKARKTGGLW